MKTNLIVRLAVMVSLTFLMVAAGGSAALAQSIGDDIGAGVFKPKNPTTKKRGPKPIKPVTKPTKKPDTALDDRIDDLLDKGNDARDAKKYTEAQDAYEGVLKLRANDARGAYGLGNVYSDQRRWPDAEKAYRDAVEWGPKDVDALVALSVVLVQPVAGANNAKRFADAQGFAQRAVQLDPKNAVAWDRLGVAIQSRGLFNDETERAYRQAVELDPQFAVAYAHLARVLRRLNKGDEATPLYERATALAKDPATLVLIADSLQAEQQWDQSEPVLRKALEADPRNTGALYLLGRALIVLKRQPEAESYLKTAIEQSPQGFQSYLLLGQAYLAMGRYDDAEKTYNSAVDLASAAERRQLAGTYGFEGVGDGYLKAKRKADAARAYRRALDLDPDNKQLQSKVAKVRG
jgi:tetratricopeptide (TPR) repeat protein